MNCLFVAEWTRHPSRACECYNQLQWPAACRFNWHSCDAASTVVCSRRIAAKIQVCLVFCVRHVFVLSVRFIIMITVLSRACLEINAGCAMALSIKTQKSLWIVSENEKKALNFLNIARANWTSDGSRLKSWQLLWRYLQLVEELTYVIIWYIDRLWVNSLNFLKEKALNCVGQ